MKDRPILGTPARLALNALLIAGGIGLVLWLLVQLRLVVVPFLLALLFSTLLVPLADRMRDRGMPSAPATLVSMLLAFGLVAGAVSIVAPAVADQLDDLGRELRAGFDQAVKWLIEGPLNLTQGEIDRSIDQAIDRLRESSGPLTRGVISGATLVAELIAGLLLFVVLVFFFVHDGRRIWGWVVSLAPAANRADVDEVGHRGWRALSGYVRGVVVIALVDAVLIGIALWIIGVPLVLPLSVLVFLGAFVPLVGAVLAGAVAALVALVSNGVVAALIVVAVITAIQQLEGDLLYPVIVGKAIDLHPAAILLVLTGGTVVAGLAGAVLAVPIAAAVWAGVSHLRRPATE